MSNKKLNKTEKEYLIKRIREEMNKALPDVDPIQDFEDWLQAHPEQAVKGNMFPPDVMLKTALSKSRWSQGELKLQEVFNPEKVPGYKDLLKEYTRQVSLWDEAVRQMELELGKAIDRIQLGEGGMDLLNEFIGWTPDL